MATLLTPKQEFALVSAGALLADYAQLLSDFQVETIALVARRWLDQRAETIITAAEWLVIEPAVATLQDAYRRPALRRIAA